MKKSTDFWPKRHKIPEHTLPKAHFSGAYPATLSRRLRNWVHGYKIPGYIGPFSFFKRLGCNIFRDISGHLSMVLNYLVCKTKNTKIAMAGKTISMTDFKQAILLKKRGTSNREIARQLGISRNTVNEKFSFINNKGYSLDVLLEMDEPELQRLFHAGHSAITEKEKHVHFLQKLDYFKEQLKDKHVTRHILWEEYRKENPDGYGKSQFYHHLS